jgi:hypothetical protein
VVEGVLCEGVILNAIKDLGVDDLWGVRGTVEGSCEGVIVNVIEDRGIDDL